MTERLNFYRITTKTIQVNLILDYSDVLKNDAVFLGAFRFQKLGYSNYPSQWLLYSVSRIQALQRASFREIMLDL